MPEEVTPRETIPLRPRQALALVAILAVAVFMLVCEAHGRTMESAAAVILLCIGLWATGWLPGWLTGLVFFSLCMAAHVAPAADVFAGFASSATWLVLSGLIIGASIRHTGLGDRLAARLAPHIGQSFGRAIALVAASSAALAFAMPSSLGRVMLLLPILRALADRLGYPEESRGRRGIILAGVLGTFLPAFAVLPANIPNNVFVGTVEAVLGASPRYGAYLLLHFPVLGLLKLAVLIALLIRLFRDTPVRDAAAAPAPAAGLTPPERHLAAVLCLAIGLWATDGWHGISAAWIGMPVAVWCLFPGSGLLGKNPFAAMKLEPVFYVAGIVSLGVLADHSGLGARVANWAVSVLPLAPNAPAANFGILTGLSSLLGLVVTLPGVAPVLTPLIPSLSAATHWPPLAVAMTQVVGFSTVLLPYQAPPLVVAIQSGGVAARDVTRVCLLLAGLTIALLWPLDYLWWVALGWIG